MEPQCIAPGERPVRAALAARIAPVVLLLGVTLAVHANTLANGFVWDDQTIIVANPVTRDLSRLGEVLLSPDERPPYYRPLARASYLVDYRLFGLSPRAFHAVNLGFALACVLALYALARRLFERRFPATVAALLLAVHPIGVETIAWVCSRNALMALLFSLVSFALFVDATERRSTARAWLSGAAFLLALLGKEPAAMLLPVLGAWAVLRRGDAPLRRALLGLVPHALATAVYGVLRTVSLGAPVAGDAAVGGAGLVERLSVNAYTIPRYLGLVLFPKDLATYRVLPDQSIWTLPWLVPAWIAIVAALWWLLRRRTIPTTVGLIWFAVNIVPISNVVPLPTTTVMADRYFFFPAVGLWLVAADALDRLHRVRPRAVAVAAAAVLCAFGVRSLVRNLDWRDDLTLSRSAVEVEPRAAGAHYDLGFALQERGDAAGARREWEAAVRLDPGHVLSLIALGTVAAREGDALAAAKLLRRALAVDAANAEAHLQLGKLFDDGGDPDAAQREWQAVLARHPGHPAANTELGRLFAVRGDLGSAERHFRAAVASNPEFAEALFNLGHVCEQTGRAADAAAFYRRFLAVPGIDARAATVARQRVAMLSGS